MDINNKKFYEAETMGGTGGNWYKEYTEARKEITRLNEKLAALQPSPLPLISAEEILKSKIDRHKWGYNFSNIQGTEGTMNDFLNIALDAMIEYADLKAPKSVPLIDKGEQRTFWDKVWDISMQAPSEDDFTDTCENQFTINKKQ